MTKPIIRNKYSGYAKDEIIDDTRVKHKDYFNMKYLYQMCHEWLMEHDWGPYKDEKWPERLYLHRWRQSGTQEIWIWWRFRRVISKLIRIDLDVDWHIIGLKNAEMVRNGKKYKINQGEAEFKIYAKIIFDPNFKFDKGILKHFKDIYWHSIIYKDFLAHKEQARHELYEFKQMLKTYFGLPNYLPEDEGNKFWKNDTLDTPFYDEQSQEPKK